MKSCALALRLIWLLLLLLLLSTCLSAGVIKGGRCLHGHGGDGSVADLGARVAPPSGARHLLRLGRLAAEVAAAHHLFGGRLAPEAARDQDLLRRRRLPSCPRILSRE